MPLPNLCTNTSKKIGSMSLAYAINPRKCSTSSNGRSPLEKRKVFVLIDLFKFRPSETLRSGVSVNPVTTLFVFIETLIVYLSLILSLGVSSLSFEPSTSLTLDKTSGCFVDM
jgi:hypothetical protein